MSRKPQNSPGAYSNRTDLMGTKAQAVQVPTGLPYGERQQLVDAQKGAVVPQAPGAPPQALPMQQVLQAAQQHAFQPVNLSAPTQRPMEPITHGLSSGPGGGPEVLGQTNTTAATLQQLAMSTGDPTIKAMAQRAAQYGV